MMSILEFEPELNLYYQRNFNSTDDFKMVYSYMEINSAPLKASYRAIIGFSF